MVFKRKNIIKYADHLWVIGIWLLVLALPIVVLRENNDENWQVVFGTWKRLIPYFGLFFINHYFLVPFLLFNKKVALYFVVAFALVVLLSFENKAHFDPLGEDGFLQREGREQMDRLPPNRRPGGPPPQNFHPRMQARNSERPRPGQIPPYLNVILVSILILGFDTGLKASVKWVESEKEKTEIENENVQNQLAFLKNQISPHFFMNTLNNIHALIDIDTEEAKEAIIKLSKLMRYLLYESEGGLVPISKEIEFIQSYVNLMKLRYSDKVKITLNIAGNIPNKNIPPMLFTSLIENAFKHGISYKEESFIAIEILGTDAQLVFEIKNRKTDEVIDKKNSGIGIENTRKRLDLIFDDKYVMNIDEDNELFRVNLSIPI